MVFALFGVLGVIGTRYQKVGLQSQMPEHTNETKNIEKKN